MPPAALKNQADWILEKSITFPLHRPCVTFPLWAQSVTFNSECLQSIIFPQLELCHNFGFERQGQTRLGSPVNYHFSIAAKGNLFWVGVTAREG